MPTNTYLTKFPYEQELIEFCKTVDVSGAEFEETTPSWNKGMTGEEFAHFRDRKHTEETKAKMRMVDKSYMKTEEYRKKMSESLKGSVPWNKGLKTPEEVKKKIGDANRGKTPLPEARKKMSESGKSRVWTEEHKKNQAEAVRKYHENKRNIKC